METLIGMGIAVGLLATTLYVGTELQRKSSWEEEALTLDNIGMQILQSFEEPLMNAGHGFGSRLLLISYQHRYAIEIYPCDKDCQGMQKYGQYKNIAPENLTDQIHVLATAPNYTRSVLSSFVDPVDSIKKHATGTVYGNNYAEYEWHDQWIYALSEKNSTWGCGVKLFKMERKDDQDIIYCKDMFHVLPCNCSIGEFWIRDNYRDWRIGPLKEFGARLMFADQGPLLEFADPTHLVRVGSYGTGKIGSFWEFWEVREWKPMSAFVIGLKASLGIPDPQDANRMLWFPDAEKNHPYLSMCDPSVDQESFMRCAHIVNSHFGGLNTELDVSYQHVLMRHVRAIRLVLIVQSKRIDGRKIEWDGTGAFVANADGTFRNGRLTKRFERIIWPPNLKGIETEGNEANFAPPRPMHPEPVVIPP